MSAGANRGDKETETEADSGVKHGTARPGFLKPSTEERGGDAKESDGDGEYVTDLLEVPGRAVSSVQGKERILEDGERINLSDGEMDCKSGGRDQPSAVSCWSY